MRYKGVVFDLDGTLVNSLEDIADSMNKVLLSYGFPAQDLQAYKYFIDSVRSIQFYFFLILLYRNLRIPKVTLILPKSLFTSTGRKRLIITLTLVFRSTLMAFRSIAGATGYDKKYHL